MPAHMWPSTDTAESERTASGSSGLGYAVGLTAWFLLAGNFVAAKFGVDQMPPWTMCFWRLTIATLVMLPLVWGERHEMMAFLRQRGLEALVIGAIGLGIMQGLVFTALSFTSAINTGIITSIAPIITLILARILLHEPMGPWQYLGSLIAFSGIVVTAVQGSLAILVGLKLGLGDLLVLVAAFLLACYTVLLRRAKFPLAKSPLLVILLAGAAIGTFPGFLFELWDGRHTNLGMTGYVALAYVAIPGGALLYLLFNWSISLLGAARAGTLLYSQMIFTALLAWLILGEAIRWYHVAGAALIVIGVVFVELLKPKPTNAAAG